MVEVTVKRAQVSSFADIGEPVILIDENGQKVGYFSPYLKRIPSNISPFSAEDLAEMMADDEGGSLEEVWKRLGAK